jgi:sensor histidine kinase regulating citrate/malate metabolism
LAAANPPQLAALLSVKQREAEDRTIDFHWQVDIEAGVCPLSPEELTQITGNLLDNALEAAIPSGRVDLSIKTSKLGLQIKASNTCVPLPPSDQNKIYAVILKYERGVITPEATPCRSSNCCVAVTPVNMIFLVEIRAVKLESL